MLGLLVAFNLLSMLVCYLVASSRQANRWYWLLLGMLLGPLAVPFVFFSGPKQER